MGQLIAQRGDQVFRPERLGHIGGAEFFNADLGDSGPPQKRCRVHHGVDGSVLGAGLIDHHPHGMSIGHIH
ncbi:hypothetical protein MSIMFI_05514 [Mycobacterium simulans]|nr:hypothetical protein MSIMFI_05514 [Mycobacterium simulans]